ncbi:hypothetical protein DOCECA_00185 [Pseudomonas sp. E102]
MALRRNDCRGDESSLQAFKARVALEQSGNRRGFWFIGEPILSGCGFFITLGIQNLSEPSLAQ